MLGGQESGVIGGQAYLDLAGLDRLWHAYLVGLGLIVLAATVVFGLEFAAMRAETRDAATRDTAMRQRMLSQQILYLAERHGAERSEASATALLSSVSGFETAHRWLRSRVAPKVFTKPDVDGVSLEAAVATFVTDARRLAGASPGAALARLRETEAIPILDRLSRMVMVLDTTSAQRMRWLEGLHLAALLAAITIIVANVLLVFRPGHRMVRSTICHLRDGTDSMERFTQAAAHDLKSPLRHVSGVLTVLEEDHGADLPGEARDLVEEARSSAERMQSLMVTLLAHARSGAAPLAMERLDLAELVADVEAELAEGLRETDGRVEIAAPLGYASGDRVLVRQLLANLIGNSVKYRAPDRAPVIRISVERFSDGLRLWVRDNGMGFDNAFAERIFEPFNRLHAANEVEGSGVGLATCRTICRRHGWRISAEGIPGEGAAFRIDLPV